MQSVIAIVVSYLLGSISFSFIIARLFKGIDIRKHGSGNAGATNTLRVLGKGPAILVLVLDVLKAVIAVWIGKWVSPDVLWVAVLCGLASIIGHNWPIFFGFRGGKGIATTIGVMMTLCFVPGLIAGVFAILSIVLTRFVSLGSLVFTALLPLVIWLMGKPPEIFWGSIIIGVFAFVRHRSNIVKLVKGKENKIGAKQ
ncbi:glycerol-3-phosphate 1-O-acyltransferase PlsY [Paenibacillus sp. N1-5-1-14]|uniref:glycerol-3-phosphate 1-O-acyltransferase PlsY n=1 Tax=Paenibacillus radicibacter TaxID=2972488 RepID=UPI00215968B6|nr:glycerol-3-phosphate 1-O-acyltransferase PlsY [Paenibacillus radicibacter]MCR8642309.1 glycerol-3-phosphate 1-O-acyltransferase PlsY [Paenibacillus radicibacter]